MADGMFDPGVAGLAQHNVSSHGSPLFDFLTAFAPRKLKDLFRLCEYLYFNSSQVYAALQKFCTYPVTDIVYETQNESLKNYYENLHDKTLKTKRILIRAAVDKFVYGNAFFSMYSPFVRFLKCTKCQQLTNITQVTYKFKLKKLSFDYECQACKQRVLVDHRHVVDKPITRKDRLSVIRWDPKLMDIDYNPITGHSEYFYTIPKELKERAAKGSKHLIDTMPMEFLKALRDDKIFKFAEGQIFHMRMDAPAGLHDRLVHALVYGIEHVHVEQAAADTGLVGGNHDPISPLVQARDRIKRTRNRAPLLGRLDELLRVEVDDAIAVENDELHGLLFLHRKARNVRHLIHQARELRKQRETIGTRQRLVRHHHHRLEETVHRVAQRSQLAQGPGVILPGDQRAYQRRHVIDLLEQRALGRFLEQRDVRLAPGRLPLLLRLAQDIDDPLVGSRERGRFRQGNELLYCLEFRGHQIDACRPQSKHGIDRSRCMPGFAKQIAQALEQEVE